MARSFTYDRPLDAKILPDAEHSKHEFRFNNLLEIKKEIDNDLSDMETGSSAEILTANSSDFHENQDPELQSAKTPQYQCTEGSEESHPKLVIKFSNLWKKTKQNLDYGKMKKKIKEGESNGETLGARKPSGNKRRHSERCVPSDIRATRSSLLTQRSSDSCKDSKSTLNSSSQKAVPDEQTEQEDWNMVRITRSKKNSNFSCDRCGLSFKNYKIFLSHVRYYTAEGDHHCKICDRKCYRRYQLIRHMKSAHSPAGHPNIYKFKCPFCIDRFERRSTLLNHVTHFHNKYIVSDKTSVDSHKELASPKNIFTAKPQKKAFLGKPKRGRKHVALMNSGDHKMTLNGNSNFTKSSAELVENVHIKDADVFSQETSRLQQNDKCLCNENDEPDLTTKKVNAGSTVHLIGNHDSKHVQTSTSDTPEAEEATTPHQVQSYITESTEEFNNPRNLPQKIVEDTSTSIQQFFNDIRIVRRQEHQETQPKNQAGTEMFSKNVQPNSEELLLSQSGKNTCNIKVSESLDQPNKTEHLYDYRSANTVDGIADKSQEMKMANKVRRTRSSGTLEMSSGNNPISRTTNIATYSDQKLVPNEESPIQEKSTDSVADNHFTSKGCSYLKSINEKPELLPQHQQSNQQVGSVPLHQVSEDLRTTKKNLDGEGLVGNNVYNNLVQFDNFEDTYNSAHINRKDEKISDCSYESISLKTAAPSPDVFTTDSSNNESHTVTPLLRCKTPNDMQIRDVRVMLLKLENSSDLSMQSSSEKSPSLEDCSMLKTDKPYYNPNDQQVPNGIVLRKHLKRKHHLAGVRSNEKLIPKQPHVSNDDHSNKISNDNRLQVHALRQGIHCHFCDAVFFYTVGAVSHYLSVHIGVGDLQCCLCNCKFRTWKRLRLHLFRNCNVFTEKKYIKFCIDCEKYLGISNPSQRCSECNHNLELETCDNRAKTQFLAAHNSMEDRPVHTLRSNTLRAAENRPESLFGTPPMPVSGEETKSNTIIIDHESARNDEKVIPPLVRKKMNQNSKCAACDRVILESTRLKHHLSAADADVKYCECGKYKDAFRRQSLAYSTRFVRREKSIEHCNNRTLLKCSIRKNSNFKSKDINKHDNLCKQKSYIQRRLRFSSIRRVNKHSIQLRRTSGCKKKPDNYKCDVCRLICCCRRNLRLHKTRYSTKGSNICNICGLTFSRKHLLVKHIKMAHNAEKMCQGRFQCEICNQGFYNNKFLRIHLAHFHNLKYFQCTICLIRFNSYRRLNNHRRYYSTNLSSICSTCDQSFKCKYMLQYHRAQVHNPGQLNRYKYSCDVCTCAFIDEQSLQEHIGHIHKNNHKAEITNQNDVMRSTTEQPPEDVENERNGNVRIESNVKSSNPAIQKHEPPEDAVNTTTRVHTLGEYKCGICKLSFSDPSAILNHEWEFSNDGTYTCDVCNRKFMTNSLLKSHKIKHYQRNVNRQHECYICKEDFSALDNLKMHGLHLHGPQFSWEKKLKSEDNHNPNESHYQIKSSHDDVSTKLSVSDIYDAIGLMTNDEADENGKILFFQKTTNHRPMECLRRHSSEDAYCCNVCKTNFSSASLLTDHIKKHSYRAYYTNSTKYLCLICKNKFRTNDVLRAHVIHCHTPDLKEEKLNEPESPKDHLPDELVQFRIFRSNGKRSNNTVQTETKNSGDRILNRENQIQLPNPEGILSGKENQSSNSPSDADGLLRNRVDHPSLSTEVKSTENHVKCSDLHGDNHQDCVDFVRHKLLHDEKVDRGRNDLNTELEPLVKIRSLEKCDRQSSSNETADPCKCEICDKVFIDFKTMLDHWNSCADTTSPQCDLCSAKFKSLNSLRVHKISCCEKKENCSTMKNRLSLRANGDKSIRTPIHSTMMPDNMLQVERTMDNPLESLTSSNSSQQNGMQKFERITVKPFAKLSPKLKNHEIPINQPEQTNAHGTPSIISLLPEFPSRQDTASFKQRDVTQIIKRKPIIIKPKNKIAIPKNNTAPLAVVPHSVNSIPRISQSHEQVSNLTIAHNSMSNCQINIEPKISDQTSRSCGFEANRTLFPRSSNNSGSSAYYLCTVPQVNSCDNIRSGAVASESSPKPQQNYLSEETPNAVPMSSNPDTSLPYYLCLQRIPTNSSEVGKKTDSLDNSDLKIRLSNRAGGKSPTLMNKELSSAIHPVGASDIQRIANLFNGNSQCDVVTPNKASLRLNSKYNDDRRDLILPVTDSSSTGGALPASNGKITAATNSTMNQNAGNKEIILKKHTIRCGFCSQVFVDKAALIEHTELHKTDNQCPACGLTFSNESALKQHLPEHKCSKCTKCNKIVFFSDSAAVGPPKHCSVCNNLLPLPKRQMNCATKNSRSRIMKCGICLDTFGTFSEMTAHFKLIHSSFVCGICASRFTTRTSLYSHMQIHARDSRQIQQCKICQKYYATKTHLAVHAVTHKFAPTSK